jgi:hypothetical protein
VRTLAEHVPALSDTVVSRTVLAPPDLEAAWGWPEGQPYHAELALDQVLFMRPMPQLSAYRAPVGGLYLCGPAMHPGAGIAGAAGANAAKVVLSGTASAGTWNRNWRSFSGIGGFGRSAERLPASPCAERGISVGATCGAGDHHQPHGLAAHAAMRLIGIGQQIAGLGKDVSAEAAQHGGRQFLLALGAASCH